MGDGVRVRVSARLGDGKSESVAEVFRSYSAGGEQLETVLTGSMGYYDLEPFVIVEKPNAPAICYANVTDDIAAGICERWLNGDDPMPEVALCTLSGDGYEAIKPQTALPLFQIQRRVATRRCGFTNPLSIKNCIEEFDGYAGFKQAAQITPDSILDRVNKTALPELDGHGEPVFPKWKAFQSIAGGEKTIVCTALDNDVEARIARLLLEGDPHGTLEGLLITALAVGASHAVIAVPADTGRIYPVLENALSEMREFGLPGKEILESGFDCDISIREVPRALVSYEKTALLNCLEGLQPIPSLSGKSGDMLFGNPALVTGIETLANLPQILLSGSGSPTDNGLPGITGTKLMTLSGGICHAYTLELPFGVSIATTVRDIGGAERVKAVQFGGLTSVFFNTDAMEKPINYETAKEAGSDFGLSLINVVPESVCAVETAEEIMRILHDESCGKCVFCREGTLHLRQMLSDVINGRNEDRDFELMTEIGLQMKSGCICALGLTAANPVLSALALFRSDFERYSKRHTAAGIRD